MRHLYADPGHTALRKALRTTLVAPTLLAIGLVTDAPEEGTLFAVFAAISLLGLADFGGPRRQRATAYLLAVAVGALAVAVGTLTSDSAVLSAVVMLVYGFAVALCRSYGGLFISAQAPLLLAFLLAATVPGTLEDVPERMIGWTLAGLVSVVVAQLVWPRFEGAAVRRTCAEACRALREVVQARADPSRDPASVRAVVDDYVAKAHGYRDALRRAHLRPAGPTRASRALWVISADLQRAVDFTAPPKDGPPWWGQLDAPSTVALIDAMTDALTASGPALRGRGARPDAARIEAARDDHRREMDGRAARALAAGRPAVEVAEELQRARSVRLLSYVVVLLTHDAATAGGLPETGHEPADRVRDRAWWSVLTLHLSPSSIWFRDSLRVAGGLALVVLIAESIDVSHGFWAALGAFSVMRGNALATGRTALQALVGTVIGFGVVAAFILLVGDTDEALWVAFPATLFLAMFAPTAFGFMAGQAAFTVCVVVLFNIITPQGWRTGLVRVEDIALGAGVALVVGGLLWPRGASGQVRSAVAALIRRSGEYLGARLLGALGDERPGDLAALHRAKATESVRAAEVFDLFLDEGGGVGEESPLSALMAAGRRLDVFGEVVGALGELGYTADPHAPPTAKVRSEAHVALDRLDALVDELASGTMRARAPLPDSAGARWQAGVAALESWGGSGGPERGRAAVGLLYLGDWVGALEDLLAEIETPTATAAQAAHQPWWMRRAAPAH
ncbi:MAG TPA: FUSC family protein [Solirubrobacteraceae bacterium]|nr:FUSC family protein [Solirubrobacteraceae bacterium]